MNNLDKFDIAILSELQTDARLTNAELAQRVGLSAAPCWRRVRALEEAGYILGYRAEIDRHKIGLGVLAFVRLDAERSTGGLTRAMEADRAARTDAFLVVGQLRRIHPVLALQVFADALAFRGQLRVQLERLEVDVRRHLALGALQRLLQRSQPDRAPWADHVGHDIDAQGFHGVTPSSRDARSARAKPSPCAGSLPR